MVIANENTRTLITIPKDLKKQLEDLAEEENRSFNNYVLNVLKKHIEELDLNKDNNKPHS